MVDQLLEQAGVARAQLTAVAFGQGPGGFTGLRVACGVAQGIAFALDLPVIPIGSLLAVAALDDSLEASPSVALAQSVRLVVQDARMGEVYLAAYRPEPATNPERVHWRVVQAPILLGATDVGNWFRQSVGHWRGEWGFGVSVRLMGDALTAYPELMDLRTFGASAADAIAVAGPLRPSADTIARLALSAWRLGQWVTPELAAPLYVRDRVAYTTKERAGGLGGNPKADGVPVAIEPMVDSDLDDVSAIERSVQSFPWTRRNFSDALEAGYSAWVARRGAKIVGFCLVMLAPDVAHLLSIAVTRDEQGKGVGALLLKQCERESAAHALSSLILEVRPSNHNAVTFYQNRGFQRLSVRKDYYPLRWNEREDAWVMDKKVAVGKVAYG
jgi:tRNA threonylcarbamoyladenosine biosynthesis protein TsaB